MTTPDVLESAPPRLTPRNAESVARDTFGLVAAAEELVAERDQNFRLTDADGRGWVLKVSNAAEEPGVVEMEVAAVERIAQVNPELPVPRARATLDGQPVGRATFGGSDHLVRLLPLLPGRNAAPHELDGEALRRIGEVVAGVGHALRGFFHPAAGRVILWDQQRLPLLFGHASLLEPGARRDLLDRVIERLLERVLPRLTTLRSQVIHNDLTLDNLLVDDMRRVSGIIDFGDMAHTALILDVPATLQSLVRERDDVFAVADAFLSGYTSVVPLEDEEAELVGDLLAGRMAQTILISAFRTRRYPDNAYIHGWSEPAWALLEQLEAVGFDAAGRRLAAAARGPHLRSSGAAPPPDAELVARRSVLGSALEPPSYRRPLHLVQGSGAWLIAADGRRYLDAYNNVPVVGHSHPRVVDAIARQAALLNTNTRYLHRHVVDLADALVAEMPDGLDTVIFVNSGSEANDLAWRLATTWTSGDAGLVTEWAYHGLTASVANLTPSEWPNGQKPDGVETFAAPNAYRGPYAETADPVAVAHDQVDEAIARLVASGRRPAALYIDSLFSADGILAPDPSVVQAIVGTARGGGALYVADEVQSGHGRTGDGLWGFLGWHVTPNIVTLGKPMGNGHPIAAVVTRAEIVDRFAAATTYFSTFGGNPVACAAALAVLEVLDDERLVARAAETGTWLRSTIAALGDRHSAIGDVRGRGLMIGVELVADRASRLPAPELATRVKDEMRERGVLIGTTGRDGNVLKIRPPLCIGQEEAGIIVSTLDEAIRVVSG